MTSQKETKVDYFRLAEIRVKQPAEPNGDAGDQYTGLDRFGRVVDQRWIPSAKPSMPTDRYQYGYDRDNNRQFRDNRVSAVFAELYHPRGVVDTYDMQGNLLTTGYDLLNRLPYFVRGQLNLARTDFLTAPSHAQQCVRRLTRRYNRPPGTGSRSTLHQMPYSCRYRHLGRMRTRLPLE